MIVSGICTSFKREILDGVHADDDAYMIALFAGGASIGPDTKKYSEQDGEVASGAGYSKGGLQLKGRSSGISGTSGFMTFANPRWSSASFTARGALIYNASKEDRAVVVINFGQDYTCTNGEFVVSMPLAGPSAIVTVT